MKRILIASFALFAYIGVALGEDLSKREDDEVAATLADCAALYDFIATCLKNTPSADKQNIGRYDTLSLIFLKASVDLSDEEVTRARFNLFGKAIVEEAQSQCSRISIPMNKRFALCNGIAPGLAEHYANTLR